MEQIINNLLIADNEIITKVTFFIFFLFAKLMESIFFICRHVLFYMKQFVILFKKNFYSFKKKKITAHAAHQLNKYLIYHFYDFSHSLLLYRICLFDFSESIELLFIRNNTQNCDVA